MAAEFRRFMKSASGEEKRFLFEAFMQRDTNYGDTAPFISAAASVILGDEMVVVEGKVRRSASRLQCCL